MENSNLEIKKYESYLTEDEENESQNEIQGNNERKSITSNHSAVSSSSYHTAQSIYTQNFKPFSIKLSLKKKTSISKIVKRKVVKDERIFILNVEYKSHDEIFDWVIYKSYREIKEVLINIHSNINNFQNTKTVIDDQQTLKKIKEYIRINQRTFSKGENILGVLEIMNNLLPSIRDKVFFLEFLEISRHSFDCFNDGNKPKEGYILKRNGNSRSSSCLFKIFCCCLSFCPSYSRRWFVLKDEMICYLEDSASDIGKEVFWFDQEILITRNSIDKLNLINGSRVLTLKFKEQFEREIWFDSINKAIQAYKNRVKNEYNSFANEKIHNYTKFFVDAEDYFSDLYDKILAAKDTIFIAGWWVSPEVFLKRPVHIDNTQYRLMDILKLKAEEGVKIHLLIYKEVRIALTVDSSHTKDVFNNLHENIKVTRHPKNRLDLLWSHHEKIVIIDQKVGYVGGIDLCWGRFDNKNHLLSEEVKEDEVYLWPGIEYNNSRLKDMINVAQYKLESVERLKDPRMPWHDVSVYLEGPVVSDLCRHFVERWNFARTYFQRDKKHTIIYSKNQYFYILVKKTSITASTMYNNREKNDNNVPSRNIIEKKEIDNLKKQGKYLNTSKVNSTNIDSGITSPLLEENDLDYNYRCLNNKYRQFPPTTTTSNLTNTNINRNVFTHLSSHKREIDTIQTIHSIDSYENQEFTERKNRDIDDEANCYPSYESDLNSFESKKAINNPINEVYEIKRDSDIKEPRVNLSKKRNTVDHSESKTHSNSSYSKISNKLDRTSKTE
jgi:phosphatidylserine/phosphatidylglycerophosphate/cardiolipin synthase-like enzyme